MPRDPTDGNARLDGLAACAAPAIEARSVLGITETDGHHSHGPARCAQAVYQAHFLGT